MEKQEEKSNYENQNLQLQQLVLSQKREKLALQKKVQQLEKQNKILQQSLEKIKDEKQEQDVEMKQLNEHIAKQDSVINKLNSLIKKLLSQNEEYHYTSQHDQSLSAPKTDAKSNKYSMNDINEKKRKEKFQQQIYLEEQQKLDMNEQIIQAYKKKKSDHPPSSKLPKIEDSNKPIIVQVHKSQLKKINPQNIIELMQKE